MENAQRKQGSQAINPGTTLLALVGPTVTGKTAVALRIAPELPAEIVSADSMQVYRGMDIGTSKPWPDQLCGITMHLLDVVDAREEFSVAQFKEMADSAISDIISRDRLPMLVGGSGLYYRAVVDNLDFSHSVGDKAHRKKIEESIVGMSSIQLHDLLREADPEAAAKIPASNRRRVLRALEVARSGDRLMSERQQSWKEYRSPYNLIVAGLEMDRPLLYRMIDDRVDRMMSGGLEEEVRTLKENGLAPGTTAGEALGYRQLLDMIDGKITTQDAVKEIKKRTRNYAKRQLTWFRKDPRVRWFRVEGGASGPLEAVGEALEDTARLVLEYMRDKLQN